MRLLRNKRFSIQLAFVLLAALSFIFGSVVDESLSFYPAKLEIPDAPQYVSSSTEIEVFNYSPISKQIEILGFTCPWLATAMNSYEVAPRGTSQISVISSPMMGIGHHNCSIGISDGNATYFYNVRRTITSNQYGIQPYEFTGSRSDIMMNPTKYSFEINLKNPFSDPLSIYEVSAESDYVNVYLNSDKVQEFATGSLASIFGSITDGRPTPGVYREYIAIQTVYDRVVVPIIFHQTPESFHFIEKKIDFGVINVRGHQIVRDIILEYSGMDYLHIKKVHLKSPSPFIRLFIHDPAHSLGNNRTMLGTITFTASMSGRFSGSIVVETESSTGIFLKELPYVANVEFENRVVALENAVLRLEPTYSVNNAGNFDLVLRKGAYHIPLDNEKFIIEEAQLVSCQHFMTISHSVQYGRSVLNIQVLRDVTLEEISVTTRTCWIEIASNTSFHKVPLHLSSGRVDLDSTQGTLLSHESKITKAFPYFLRDSYEVDIGEVSQMEPRDTKLVITNYNPADELLTSVQGTMDVCACVVAYIPIGLNSLARCVHEMSSIAVVDYPFLTKSKSSRCLCAGDSPSTLGTELRSGFHTIVSLVYRNMRPISPQSHFYQNISAKNPSKKRAWIRLVTDHQELALNLHYEPLPKVVEFECIDSFFCHVFPIGLRHVNIRVAVPNSNLLGDAHANPRLLFDTATSLLTLRTHYLGMDHVNSVFDARLAVVLFYHNVSRLFKNSVWYSALHIAKESQLNIDHALQHLVTIETDCMNAEGGIKYLELYAGLTSFKEMIGGWFINGLPLNQAGLIIASREVSKTFGFLNPLTVLPQQVMPSSYELDVLVGSNRVSFLYLEYFNPFETPITVALLSNHSMGFVKLVPDKTSPIPWEKVDAERKLSIREIVGAQRMTESVLVSAAVLEAFDGARLPQTFVVSGSANIDNLIRFPQREWTVPSRQKMVLGPIEIVSSGSNNEATFAVLLYNSFSGFDKLLVSLNNTRSKIVVSEVKECHLKSQRLSVSDCDWRSLSVLSSMTDNKDIDQTATVKIPFRRSQSTFAYKFVLHNIGTSLLVSKLTIGDMKCVDQQEQRSLTIDHLFKRAASGVSICNRLPFEILHNKTLELDILVQELNIFRSFPMQIAIYENVPSGHSSNNPVFDVHFVFEELPSGILPYSPPAKVSFFLFIAGLVLLLLVLIAHLQMSLPTVNVPVVAESRNMTPVLTAGVRFSSSGNVSIQPVVSKRLEIPSYTTPILHSQREAFSFRLSQLKESISTDISKSIAVARVSTAVEQQKHMPKVVEIVEQVPLLTKKDITSEKAMSPLPEKNRRGKSNKLVSVTEVANASIAVKTIEKPTKTDVVLGIETVNRETRKIPEILEEVMAKLPVVEAQQFTDTVSLVVETATVTENQQEIKHDEIATTFDIRNDLLVSEETIGELNDEELEVVKAIDSPVRIIDISKGPPGLVQQHHRHEIQTNMVDKTETEVAEVDDSPVFQYQGQLLGLEDDSEFHLGASPFTGAQENKFLSSLSSFGHQSAGQELSLHRHFGMNLDFESDFDLTGQMSLFDSEATPQGLFEDDASSSLFSSTATPMNSLLSFLNDASTTFEPTTTNPLHTPLNISNDDDFRWLGMNKVGNTSKGDISNFFGPNQFFDINTVDDLHELEK